MLWPQAIEAAIASICYWVSANEVSGNLVRYKTYNCPLSKSILGLLSSYGCWYCYA